MASAVAFTLILCALVAGSAASEASDVTVLTPDNFEEHVGKDRGALVEFYAPWCGHCKKLAPEYEKLGTAFKKTKNVLIAKVDCDEHKSVCSKYDVSGFPTLKWFPKGSLTPTDYSGGRTAEDLVSFVNEQEGVSIKLSAPVSEVIVLTTANFDDVVLDESKDVLVEFYAPWCGHCKSLAPVYEQVAAAYKGEKNVVVAKLDADAHKDLATKYDVSGYPTLKFFPRGNKKGEDYDGGRSLDEFVTFLNDKAGTFRTSSGALSEEAGKIESLDAIIIEEYLAAATPEERKEVSKKIGDEASKLDGSAAGYAHVYLKVLKSIDSKGEDYPKKEHERLQRILSGSAVNAVKADELTVKKNILSSFLKQ